MHLTLRAACLAIAVLAMGCRGRAPATPAVSPTSGAAAEAPAGAPSFAAPAVPGTPGTAAATATIPAAAAMRDPSLQWQNDLSALGNDYACLLKEVVTDPQGQDPRAVVWRAYDAARKAVVEGADGTHAEEFADQFTRAQKRGWILEQYWPRIKSHISKYTASSKDTTYVLCRVEERDGRWKGFVKSFSRDKSNPPITVEIEDGVPRISFFTY